MSEKWPRRIKEWRGGGRKKNGEKVKIPRRRTWTKPVGPSLFPSGVDAVAEGRRNRRRSCSSSDNEVAGAVLQNWFFVQDFWPMGQRFSRCCFFELAFGASLPLRSIARSSGVGRMEQPWEGRKSGRFLVIVLYLAVGAVAVAFAACLGFLYGLERGRSETRTRIPASDGQLSRSRPVSFPGPADNSIRSRVSNRFRDFFHGWFHARIPCEKPPVSRVFEKKSYFNSVEKLYGWKFSIAFLKLFFFPWSCDEIILVKNCVDLFAKCSCIAIIHARCLSRMVPFVE